ncbi:protein ECERIFERUM 26-like [Aristolochia californica]|uniref:protein ECERIFERUM 26-like n=1 Tax=Aristolochia californica TaxID=171875 RepID=UPI0035DBBCA0
MVSDEANAIFGVRISSVVPAAVTGETAVHELTNLDLSMKLHYLRVVYYFDKEAVEGLDIPAFKKPMFMWLNTYCSAAGRVRRLEGQRPFIKCNDAGVRIMESKCSKSLREWLEVKDHSLHRQVVSNQVIDPNMHFSPLVFLQFTYFKCGGISIGLSWAHLLGDAVTASIFINMWGEILAGKPKIQAQYLPRTQIVKAEKANKKPLSAKQILVKDRWIVDNENKMETIAFTVTDTQLRQLQSKISGQFSAFETIAALFWKCLAQIRGERQPKLITIFRNDAVAKGQGILSNKQIISTAEAHFDIPGAQLSELAKLMAEGIEDESKAIEAMMETENGLADVLVYGTNLTFVDLEDADFHGLNIKGKKPVHVSFNVDGVGDEGAVFVHRVHENYNQETGGRMVTVILPENQVLQLQNELKGEWNIN